MNEILDSARRANGALHGRNRNGSGVAVDGVIARGFARESLRVSFTLPHLDAVAKKVAGA
jgi:hypothetical protein